MKTSKLRTPKNQQSKRRLFSEHLQELRSRILWYIGFLVLGTLLGYLIHSQILAILLRPLHQPVFYISPAGGFDFVLKISFFFGFLTSLPVLVFHSMRFIEPALPENSPRLLLLLLAFSSVLLITGIGFAYFVSLPAALYFLNTFSSDEVKALISTSEYFTFVTRYLLGFGLVFQLPLIMIAINSFQKISLKSLLRFERWIIVISFVIAGIFTPTPDIFNQLMMAVPLLLLYQITLISIWFINKKEQSLSLQKP
jgi:sec-independent protein translocase protein TatC